MLEDYFTERMSYLTKLTHPGRQGLKTILFDFTFWVLNFPISHPVLQLPADFSRSLNLGSPCPLGYRL